MVLTVEIEEHASDLPVLQNVNHQSKQGYKMQHLGQKRMDIRVYRRGGLEQARGGLRKMSLERPCDGEEQGNSDR